MPAWLFSVELFSPDGDLSHSLVSASPLVVDALQDDAGLLKTIRAELQREMEGSPTAAVGSLFAGTPLFCWNYLESHKTPGHGQAEVAVRVPFARSISFHCRV